MGTTTTVIAKGTGSVGNKGYKLRESMELVHDTDLLKNSCEYCFESSEMKLQ